MRLAPTRFLFITLAVAATVIISSVLLPHDPYIRFQYMAKASVHYMRAKWIFERIHFDSTPIDVAFIGTSHTQSAVDSKVVEEAMRSEGKDVHVVNFAIPHLGRDLNYLIVRELVENRRVERLVIELQEGEARAPHPAFGLLGTGSDLILAPMIVNTDYFANLARLPQRQFDLLVRSVFPKMFGMHREFLPDDYVGAHWNDTFLAHGMNAPRTSIYSADYFAPQVSSLRQTFNSKQSLGRKLAVPFMRHRLLYRYNLVYLEELLNLAKQKGIDVVFLYLPFLDGPNDPADLELVQDYGPILTPREILDDVSSWQNVDHFNVYGALRLSNWLGDQLKALPHHGQPLVAIR